jgi:hypothetical protein
MTSKLRERIDQRGIGLFATRSGRERFLSSLPDVERARWIEILTTRLLVHVLEPNQAKEIHEQGALEDLKREYVDIADLVVCGREQARALGLDAGQEHSGAPEVASICDLDLVDAFGYDETSATHTRTVRSGEQRETVWEEWIAPLAARVCHLAIVDRYAFKNEMKSRSHETGFRWLLPRVLEARRVASPLKLELVIENDKGAISPSDLSRVIASFGLRDPDPSIFKSVAVWLADKEFGQQHLHDRMLRFDGRVLDCGTGLQVFSEPAVYQTTKIDLGSFKESEETLQLTERHCIGARWRSKARLWLSTRDNDQIQFEEADE